MQQANHDNGDQALVAAVLASRPADEVPADFLMRVNARINARRGEAEWFELADFRAWTLRLVPLAGVLVLLGVLWPGSSNATQTAPSLPAMQTPPAPAQPFTPASASDWQREVTANALLEAALKRTGDAGGR